MSDGPIGFTWDATAGQPVAPSSAMVAFAGGEAAEKLHQATAEERDRMMLRCDQPLPKIARKPGAVAVRRLVSAKMDPGQLLDPPPPAR